MVLPAGATVEALRGPLLAGVEELPIAALIMSFVLVAPSEEAAKYAVLAGFAGRRTVFNEPMDGLVYGGVTGLGFAAAENIAYVASGGLELAFLRAATTVPMHAATGVIMGFFFGLARFVPDRRPLLLCSALLVPIGLHAAYNFPLILSDYFDATGRSIPWLQIIALAVLAFEIGLALALLRRLRRSQRAGLHEAAEDVEFHEVDQPFQRFSTARHLKGPAAVATGGVIVWLTGTALLTLVGGSLAALLKAHPASAAGRARAAAEDILHGLSPAAQATVLLLLLVALMFGFWLFGRGISWLNRHDIDAPVEKTA
jgi:hypothetical protein